MANIKNAKYRIKNEQGQYEVVHFETSMGQVHGLNDKVAEVEGLINDRYNKSETDVMFRGVETEINEVEKIAEGLNGRLTTVEGEVSTLKSDLASEIARATGVEADLQAQINGLDGKIEAINHAETGILKQAKDYTDAKVEEAKSNVTEVNGKLDQVKGELEGAIDSLTGVVEANKTEIQTSINGLDGRLTVVEGKVATLEGNVVDLVAEDARLATEIQNIKDVIAGQGSDTKVFATMDEFIGASLTPKIGDMVFVLDIKKAFIYKGADAPAVLDVANVPAGWVIFDEISTEIDLVDYAKKSEVEALINVLDAKVVAETERALGAEQALNDAIEALRLVVAENTAKITALEGVTATHTSEINTLKETTYNRTQVEELIDQAVTAQMSYGGKTEPQDKKTGHVWIEFA